MIEEAAPDYKLHGAPAAGDPVVPSLRCRGGLRRIRQRLDLPLLGLRQGHVPQIEMQVRRGDGGLDILSGRGDIFPSSRWGMPEFALGDPSLTGCAVGARASFNGLFTMGL